MKACEDKMYAVYIYIYQNRIVYVGKTNSNIFTRIWTHQRVGTFDQYPGGVIYYALLNNSAETTIYETILINNFRPELNASMVYDNARYIDFDESLLQWIKFVDIKELNFKASSIQLNEFDNQALIKEKKENKKRAKGSGYWITRTKKSGVYYGFVIRVNGKKKYFYGDTKAIAYNKYILFLGENNTVDKDG